MERPRDDKRYREAFRTLARRLQRRWSSRAEEQATMLDYHSALADVGIDAVVAAADQLGRDGTSDGWFPRAPEWLDVALGIECRAQLEALDARKALPPADRDEQIARAEAAKVAFCAESRRLGFGWLALYFERMSVGEPEGDARYCQRCSDTGSRERPDLDGRVHRCECVQRNPRLRLRWLRGQVDRRQRARKALPPARGMLT